MASPKKQISAYCDESCHLQSDGCTVMALGSVYCPTEDVKVICGKIRDIKRKHNLTASMEIKWSKVSKTKKDFYIDLITLFFNESVLRFRGILVPDKSKLDHLQLKRTHDDFYYEIYEAMLTRVINPMNQYFIYLDIKDTKGGPRTKALQKKLASRMFDINEECVSKVQQIRSHESELLQLGDLLTGALTYANRQLSNNEGKVALIEEIKKHIPKNTLTASSNYHYDKFNILIWPASK